MAIICLHAQGYDVPLVADIHFQPQIAMDVAEVFEKIRINPGNFIDGRKTFEEYVYDSKVGLPLVLMFCESHLLEATGRQTRSFSSCFTWPKQIAKVKSKYSGPNTCTFAFAFAPNLLQYDHA